MGKRVQQRTAQSDVLPAGKFVSNVEFKENSKTVSKPHALPMFRKSPQTVHTTQSTIFDPPQPIQQRTEVTKAGKALHSDPFDATRQDATFRVKKMISQDRPEPHQLGTRKVAPIIHDDAPSFPKGGKLVVEQRFQTTIECPQETKNYANMMRFQGTSQQRKRTDQQVKARPHRKVSEKTHVPTLDGVMKLRLSAAKTDFKVRPPWGTGTPRQAVPAAASKRQDTHPPWHTSTPRVGTPVDARPQTAA